MIAIVGAGITGLTVGHELEKRGLPFVVFEARDRVGGVMWTRRADDGQPLDVGPQRTRLTGEVRSLVEEVGLEDELVRGAEGLPVFVYRDGRLRPVPFTPGEAIRTDLLSWPEKLRVLAEPATGGLRSDETVAGFFTRKFGGGAYRAMIGPMYGGLYASDPARMPARHALATVLEEFGLAGGSLLLRFLRGMGAARDAVPTVSFREGMQALPRALAGRLGERVRLEAPVSALRRNGDARFAVDVGAEAVEADAVVLTLPAPDAARILEGIAPDAAGRLAGLTYNPLAVVHLRSGCALRGFGYQVAFGEELVTRGVTWNASIFDRDGIYTAYLGGMKSPEVEGWPDERAADVACSEFRRVTGCEAEALAVSRIRMPAWDRSWDALDDLELPGGVHLCSNYTARPGVPGRIRQARELAQALERGTAGGA